MSAGLINLLLLMAGIESNPGPYFCPVCLVKLKSNSTSVQCNKCLEWVHLRRQNNCSELKSRKDYSKFYICSTCLHDPLPNPSNPSLLSSLSPSNPPANSAPPPSNRNKPHNNDDRVYNLNILQWNCNGIRNKTSELSNFIQQHQIKVVVLQETKLSNKSTSPEILNFSLVRKDRLSDKGGGLAIYIHNSIQYLMLPDIPSDGHTEYLGVKVGDTNIINVYIPPTSSCSTGFKPNIINLLPAEDSLVLGDFNAHDSLWNSSIQDARGSDLADIIGSSSYGVLNENHPTRVPSNGQSTSPDISLASASLMNNTEWTTVTSLGSDHLPIIIKSGTTIKPIRNDFRNFINFQKADWPRFNTLTESAFLKLPDPTDVHASEKLSKKLPRKLFLVAG